LPYVTPKVPPSKINLILVIGDSKIKKGKAKKLIALFKGETNEKL
jgi:hypothetical protein